jgi:hypothetical protein
MGKPEVPNADQPFKAGEIFESGYGMRVHYVLDSTQSGFELGVLDLAADDLVARLAQLEPPVTADRNIIKLESMTRPLSSVLLLPGQVATSTVTLFYPHPGPTNRIDSSEL